MAEQTAPNPPYDVIIIGGGPAGLTAGMYAARAALRTLSIEGASTLSQITATDLVENYPGISAGATGFDLVERFRAQAVAFGLETVSGDVTAISKKRWGNTNGWEIAAGERRYGAFSVILATGAAWRRLGVPGEEKFIGRGISFCATCDGPFSGTGRWRWSAAATRRSRRRSI